MEIDHTNWNIILYNIMKKKKTKIDVELVSLTIEKVNTHTYGGGGINLLK